MFSIVPNCSEVIEDIVKFRYTLKSTRMLKNTLKLF